jgi:alkanesulfonate monooxygenase SsuD/methylene tetrahydromethanopterin reductase-like flavin-dependent oxidoreductase (luciferase family)
LRVTFQGSIPFVQKLSGRTTAELEQRVQGARQLFSDFAAMPLDALLDEMRDMFGAMIVGTPDEVIRGIRAYADVGVEELIIQWFGMGDLDGLALLAEQVLPDVAA